MKKYKKYLVKKVSDVIEENFDTDKLLSLKAFEYAVITKNRIKADIEKMDTQRKFMVEMMELYEMFTDTVSDIFGYQEEDEIEEMEDESEVSEVQETKA